MARGPAPLLGELSAQLTERLPFNERPAGRQPRLSVLAPFPYRWSVPGGLAGETTPILKRAALGDGPYEIAYRRWKRAQSGGLMRRGRPKGGRRTANCWLLTADGKKKTRPGERAGLFLSIYRMRQCSIVE